MSYKAWFQCSSGCDERYELNEIIYKCKKCGDLLEVKHDIEKLKHRSPESWMKLFDKRYRRTDWPHGSSVWGKKEMVCQNVSNESVNAPFAMGWINCAVETLSFGKNTMAGIPAAAQ